MCVCVCGREKEIGVCERERERVVRERSVYEREGCVRVCVCVRERERGACVCEREVCLCEREKKCVCVRVCVRVRVYVSIMLSVTIMSVVARYLVPHCGGCRGTQNVATTFIFGKKNFSILSHFMRTNFGATPFRQLAVTPTSF